MVQYTVIPFLVKSNLSSASSLVVSVMSFRGRNAILKTPWTSLASGQIARSTWENLCDVWRDWMSEEKPIGGPRKVVEMGEEEGEFGQRKNSRY